MPIMYTYVLFLRVETVINVNAVAKTAIARFEALLASSTLPPMISGVNSLALTTLNQLPPSPLPVVPPRIWDRIVRGEFVDVHESLPERLMLQPDDCFMLSMGAGRWVLIRRRSASCQVTRCRVLDMASWLETFTLYSRVLMDALPNRAGKLLAYQARILEANSNYHSDAWLAYDLWIRQAIVAQPNQHSWTTIDVNLWQACFTSRDRQACIRNAHFAAEVLWSLLMLRASHQSMRASKYAKITIEHGEPTRLALVLMCVYCAEESARNQVPQTQPHQALWRLILLLHNHPNTIFATYVLSGITLVSGFSSLTRPSTQFGTEADWQSQSTSFGLKEPLSTASQTICLHRIGWYMYLQTCLNPYLSWPAYHKVLFSVLCCFLFVVRH